MTERDPGRVIKYPEPGWTSIGARDLLNLSEDELLEGDKEELLRRVGHVREMEDELDERLAEEPGRPREVGLDIIPLAEVEDREPEPLLLDRLDPESHTVLFGDGGTGKGVVAAWWAARLTREGRTVLVLDYERNARYEWKPRVRAFGGDLKKVLIAQPEHAIWTIAPALARELEVGRLAADYLIVDSVAYACVGQEVEKSVTATRYSLAIAEVGLPSLSLAHTTKDNADPKHPFGSVFWSNGARMTIGMTGAGDGPRVLTNKKTNQRAPFAPVEIDWSWVHHGLPPSLEERASRAGATVATRAYEALGDGTMTEAELLAAAESDGLGAIPAKSLETALRRRKDLFRSMGGRPQAWCRSVKVSLIGSGGQVKEK